MIGKVLWFNVKDGYGFVRGLEDGVDYFAHFSKIIADQGTFRSLQKGDAVDFTPSQSDRGDGSSKPQALQIKVVGGVDGTVLREDDDHNFRGHEQST